MLALILHHVGGVRPGRVRIGSGCWPSHKESALVNAKALPVHQIAAAAGASAARSRFARINVLLLIPVNRQTLE